MGVTVCGIAGEAAVNDILTAAARLHGQLYADILRADIAIARRQRDEPPVPQAWRNKRRRMGRELDVARREFSRVLERARREFWK